MSEVLHLIGAMQPGAISGISRSIAGALVAGVWQGIVLCAGAGLILKLVPKTTATLRFAVWAAVFIVSVAMPFVHLPGSEFGDGAGISSASHLVLGLIWSYSLAGLWLVAALYRFGQLAFQMIGLRSLWLSATPVADEASSLDLQLSRRARRVQLCTSDDVDRPCVLGFLSPRILVPAWLFEQLTPIELNHIVLHEMEHLRRRDDWVNLMQKIGLVLLPLNPALFWIDRRLSTERELACDDGVLERTQMPRAYAASLASIAERRMDVRRHGRFGALALAATGLRQRSSELGERIESILGRRAPVNRAVTGSLAGLLVFGMIGAGAELAHAPQLVSFGPGAVPLQAVVRPEAIMPTMAPAHVVLGASGTGIAKFQNVSFREAANVRSSIGKTPVRRAVSVAKTKQIPQEVRVATAKQRQFVVLTSWEDSPVSRVVVQTPDGKFYLAPYAAVPTQAGWLLVQL